ncbi:MAG: hypothetical protein UH654_03255 [Lachnospiraceae bacterium]|nr:hypothetical protein [Lachnospiraceae bacterium]
MTMENKKIKTLCHISIVILAVIAGISIYGYEKTRIFYEQNLGLIEVMCLVGTLLLIYFSSYICTGSIISSFIGTLVIMPIVYMALRKLTFYLTVDEIKAINEQLYITDADSFTKEGNHWFSGDSRTNYVILGTLVKLAPLEWFKIHGVSPEQVTKALHWIMGMITIDIIVVVTYIQSFGHRKDISGQNHNTSISYKNRSTENINQNNIQHNTKNNAKEQYSNNIITHIISGMREETIIIILFYAIMSLQVTLLSIKTVNYDLNSLLLALLSVMLMIYAIRKVSSLNALMAVVSAMLATQDKMLAGPMLYLALLIMVIILTIKVIRKNIKIPLVLIAVAVTMIPVIMSYMANYYVGFFLAGGNIPSVTFHDTVYSYVQYSLTILESISSFFALSDKAVIVNLLMLWGIFTIASYITKNVDKSINNKAVQNNDKKNINNNVINTSDKKVISRKESICAKRVKIISAIVIALVFMMFIIAIISIRLTPFVYMSPLYKMDVGSYNSKSIMNGITYHFNAKSMAEHYAKLAGTIIYIFYKSVPVGYMVLLAAVGVVMYIYKKRPDISNMLFILLSAVIFPLLYSAIQITPNERYQNVYILIFAYLTVVTLVEMVIQNKKIYLYAILTVMLINAIDVHRYDYAYTEYFAIWDTKYIEQREECYTGKMVPGYHAAWGEHVIYAGEMLGRYAHDNNIPYKDMNIHYEYYGEYYNNGGMNIIVDGSEAWKTCEIGEHDYFVVSRGAATKEGEGGLSIKLINNATPMYTFGYNGATEMWVYSGEEVMKWR